MLWTGVPGALGEETKRPASLGGWREVSVDVGLDIQVIGVWGGCQNLFVVVHEVKMFCWASSGSCWTSLDHAVTEGQWGKWTRVKTLKYAKGAQLSYLKATVSK
jgi:hypothetical protein